MCGEDLTLLGRHIRLIKGVSYRKAELTPGGGAKLVNLACVRPGGGFLAEGLKDYAGKFKQEQMLWPGDVAVALTDVTQHGLVIGRPLRIPSAEAQSPLVASLDIAKIVPSSDAIDMAWLYHRLRAPDYAWHVTSCTTGTTVRHLSLADIARFQFLLPPLSEQRAIAEVLGALDDKIEANQHQVQCLLNLIGADWHLRFYDSRDQWPQLPIGEVCTVVGGSTPRTTVQEYWDGNIAWATPKDLSRLSSPPLFDTERRITELGLRQISSGLLPRGTVLLSSRAPIGYLAIAELPVAVNQGVIALVPSERLPGLYLWQWLSHNLHEVMTRANGTTFLEVSKTNFRSMPIAVPPEKDLVGWVEIAEPMYRLIFAREIENKELVEVRDTLLPKLLSGELRVRDAEPLVEEVV